MLGFVIGVASGAVQFWMLAKFTSSITHGTFNNKTVIFAITQFLLPLVVLVGCAFLLSESLMWTGIGIAASLIICAAVRFILTLRSIKR